MQIDAETVARLRRLCAAASPVPWEADIDDPGETFEMWTGKFYTGDGVWCSYESEDRLTEFQQAQNARLVAEARNHLPVLLDEIERLRAELDKLQPDPGAIHRTRSRKRGCR